MEHLRSVTLTAVIDTNKATYRIAVDDLPALVAWWNDQAEDLGLPTYTLNDDGDPPAP